MSTPTPAPDNNATPPPPLTVSAPLQDTTSSTPPPADSVPSPVSASPPAPDTLSPPPASTSPPPPASAPTSDTELPPPASTSPPPPASAPPPGTEVPPPASISPPPPASASPPDNQSPPPPTAPSPPTPAASPPPPPPSSSPSPPPPSTSSPPPSSDSSPPPSTSSPPATPASPPPSSSPPTSSASPPPPSTSSPPSSSASPPPPSTSSPPRSSVSPPPPSTSSPPSSSVSPPPPSNSSPPTSSVSPPPPSTSSSPSSSASPPPSTSPPPTFSASPPSPSTFPTSPPPPSTSSPPTSSASPTPPPLISSPPTSSASSTPTPSTFLPPPPSTSSTSPSLLPSPPLPLSSSSTPVDSSSSGISVAVVVGIGLGGVAILLVLILLFVCYRKKRRNHDAEAFHAKPPFTGYKDVTYGGPRNYSLQSTPPLPGPIERLMSNASAPLAVNAYAPPFLQPSFNSTGSNYSGHQTSHPPPPLGSVLGSSKSSFSYEELALATNGFSEANLLGQGGFGYVHRGVLPNGKEVAIKQLKAGSGQGEREFQAEVEIISRVHHKHLVSLVGYCITGSQRLLVYEYIPNNNLEFHLHEKGRLTMDWSARVRIALGSAKGLSYLHEDCNPKIIHRDIKAANILLDFKFEAKVADFGLAKFTSDIHTHVSTRVMGTFGYLAPEYASSGKLSEKSDVFSFGVVLLELITGHRPVDTTQTFMEDSLVDWARPLLVRAIEDENYDGLVDPKLQGNFIPTEMARMVACAAACVRHSAKRRPRMIQVVRALEGDATLPDLNKGVRPGPSTVCDESSAYDTNQYKEDMKKFRKMALESQECGASGVAYSAGTSEYGLYPSSSSSSSDAQISRAIEMKRWRNDESLEFS